MVQRWPDVYGSSAGLVDRFGITSTMLKRFHSEQPLNLQVVQAPYIMAMLLAHAEEHTVPSCVVSFLIILACSAQSEQRRAIVNSSAVLKLVEAATAANSSCTASHATKLRALFATSSAIPPTLDVEVW